VVGRDYPPYLGRSEKAVEVRRALNRSEQDWEKVFAGNAWKVFKV